MASPPRRLSLEQVLTAKLRLFLALDAFAHLLYAPTMLGRSCARARWHHRIHLIPGALLTWGCDRLDLWLGVAPDELRRTRQPPQRHVTHEGEQWPP